MRTTRRHMLKIAAASMTAAMLDDTVLGAQQHFGSAQHTVQPASQSAPDPRPSAFEPLSLGQVRPAGWLERQLRLQADGLSGHLGETWPDVGPDSGWLGGKGESWERGPYYLDGLVPLAVLLQDDRLRGIADRFIDWTLTHQRADGSIGPPTNDDWWPRMVMVKVLAQHFEATGDSRVLPVLTRYFHYQLAAMPTRPLQDWGKFRWQDEAYVVQWLHARTGDRKLLDLAALLRAQGLDWVGSFADFPFKQRVTRAQIGLDHGNGENNALGYQSHGVNNGQALKTAAVQFRMDGKPTNRDGFFRQIQALDTYHGMPNGMFSCDEHLAGLSPSQGSELCTVVETMFSLEIALAAFGDAAIADRIEKIAYNALPATLTSDMWAHQYDQQSNQIQCSLNSKPWTTNGVESNLFGLEPHFGCCTANYHQGWPKLVASLWMRTQQDGLAAVLYGPCRVETQVRGKTVRLSEQTDYPFRESIDITVDPEAELHFPLQFRIPAWANRAELRVNGVLLDGNWKPGTFATIDRTWKPGDSVNIRFPMPPRVTRWQNRSIAVERGPLVFSYSPGEHWVKLRDRGLTADWQVFPDRAWNYALHVDEQNAAGLSVHEEAVPAVPFASGSAPVRLQVNASMLDTWRAEDGVAPSPPPSPVHVPGPTQTLTLVPYGTARLRITAFPQAAG